MAAAVSPTRHAWVGLAALLGALALLAWPVERHSVDWQPALVLTQPWRAWTAVAVHYSALHLGANLLGTLLVGALGAVARLPVRMVWAWLAAWPMTQWGLLLKPQLLHYGGLSGVLHAGVAVTALHLVLCGARPQRWIGAAILAGLIVKVVGETPWGEPLRHSPGWDIAVAPIAHATGLLAGLLCAAAAHALAQHRRRAPD
ncbi:MAG: rhombosortase [Rhizobacter sp.]|nr:rhombosortase [Rhizobacter sp.]